MRPNSTAKQVHCEFSQQGLIMHGSSYSEPPSGQRASDWNTIRSLLPYLWEFRGRVILAMAFLVFAKVAKVGG